jgi:serine/threonine-protein kinase
VPFSAGDKLGPYEILAKIGAGGMGEVYRAHDPRLRRDVAIKVSAERFSERFDREAHAVAALNHPNICAIYDVGPNYLVMEYIEGEAPKGPLPLEEALGIARQIGDALEEAHGKEVVHRDLKPANIKIKPDGTVKVLDFGLAKMGAAPAVQSENSPTISMAATQAGMILGTAAYMSPEQARGKVVDKRADIWAFGVVLYELLTGRKLFGGEDISDTLAAVIKEEPKLDQVPRQVRRLLKSCLEKDPKNRLRDIADAWKLLDDAPSSPVRPDRGKWLWPGIAAALAILAGVALWAPWRSTQPADRPLVRLDVDLGPDISLAAGRGSSDLIISPDGTRLVYVASVSGSQPKLLTRRLDQPKATELPRTEGASSPFFSPDGQWVGFASGTRVSKISVEGGAVVPLADSLDSTFFGGASWGEDGNIIAGQFSKGLVRIPASGGVPTSVTELEAGEVGHVLPQILPGGKAVLFVDYTAPGSDSASIQVVTLADGRRKTLGLTGSSPRYLATSNGSGHVVYSNNGTLFAIPFDLDRLETRGMPVPVLEAAYSTQSGAAQFGSSSSGTLVYRTGSGGGTGMMTVQWLDRTGKKEPLWAKPGIYATPRFSPDGKRLALSVNEGGREEIWIYDQQRAEMRPLTSGGGRNPVWSPNGRHLVFSSVGGGMSWTRADGGGGQQQLTQSKNVQIPYSFSPDGKRVAYTELNANGQEIFALPVEDNGGQLLPGKPESFRPTHFNASFPAFSPDGRWVAYRSIDSGRPEVVVRAFHAPAAGQDSLSHISNSGGNIPVVWSLTSPELMYQSGDQLMAVEYSVKGDSFEVEKPTLWVAKLGAIGGIRPAWDLAPDGKRLAVVMPAEATEASKAEHEVVFLLNFFEELQRRVPLTK